MSLISTIRDLHRRRARERRGLTLAEGVRLLRSPGAGRTVVVIVSAVELVAGAYVAVEVKASGAQKCERCWHYRDDVGHDEAHPGICGRCTSNLHGAGETRSVA